MSLSFLTLLSKIDDIIISNVGEKGKREGWVAASRLVTSGITAYHHSAKIKSMLRGKEANDTVTSEKVSKH